MNKKFSTLVASLLLAGAWMTMDAAVVRVKPAIGGKYVVGIAGEAEGEVSAWTGTDMTLGNAATVDSEDDMAFELKAVEGKEGVFYLKNADNFLCFDSDGEGYLAWNETSKSKIEFKVNGGGLEYVGLEEGTATFSGKLLIEVGETGSTVRLPYDGYVKPANTKALEFFVYNDDVTFAEETLELQDEAKTGEYYVIAATDEQILTDDGEGNVTAVEMTEDEAELDNVLWTITTGKAADGTTITYKLTNKKSGKSLVIENRDNFIVAGSAARFTLGVGNDQLLGVNGDALEVNVTAANFGVYKSPVVKLNSTKLNDMLSEGFNMTIKKTAAGKETIEGLEAFAGDLVATQNDKTRFQIKNGEKYIALNKTGWDADNTGVAQRKTKFVLTDKVADACWFEFTQYAGTASELVKEVTVYEKEDATEMYGKLFISSLEGKHVLTVTPELYEYETQKETLPYITLGADNIVKPEEFLKNGFAVIKQLNEDVDMFVVATTCDNSIALAESVVNDVEKQWAVSYDVEKKVYKMVNRENTAVEKEVSYTLLRENGDKKDNIYVYNGTEYEITFVPVDASSNYYKYLSEGTDKNDPDLAEKSFVMSYWSTVFNGYANVAINDKDWAFIDTKAVQAEFTATAVDTVAAKTLINYYDATKKEWQKNEPVLKAPVYEFTVGDLDFGLNKDGKFALLDDEATAMAIRVAGEHFNLAKAKDIEGKNTAKWDGKVYVGNNDSYMYSVNCLYDDNKNTLFMVADNNRPEYRRLGKTVKDGYNDMEGDLNILKFFRTNDENQFLYENTMNRNANNGAASLNFLGETNLADKPANAQLPFLVDTAYIRNETRKPLYLLSVRNEFVKGKEAVACPDHGFDPNCPHWTAGTPDHRTGAYLVTLDDSVATYAQAKYQGNIRLAFVDATHVGDSLIIASSKYTGTKTTKNDTLSFVKKDGKQRMNAATFAFKLVDRAVDPEGDKATFIIEAVPASENGPARYVRVHNTVPVLVDNIAEAATFEVMAAAEGETATSNEGIEATGVSVVATNGAVIVKGAEGKNVVITNVLGQQVANTVVSSSEASIAAPAGMVVVAVEGEAAVKAIVK
ncbi:DUF6383 domain-containing protein [Parabacteroides sp.]|uniref:DUF6383 domain-containing protein n=1 Tax=Parabacteroides sp. TaxID=1869337 RepID=UPI00307FEA1B